MHYFKKIIVTIFLLLFTACGTGETQERINTDLGFDMWDYMTSARSYEVEYDVYENGVKTDFYVETHQQFGEKYERESEGGLTTLRLRSNTILMDEPNMSTTIRRFLHLGEQDVFQSNAIEDCILDRFHETYENQDSIFHNVLQVTCNSRSGVYQEFYYGYNEGIVAIYEKEGALRTEYIKVGEKEIY